VPRSQKTILCIDDHEAALSGWCLYFQAAGYRVIGHTQPELGLQDFATRAIDAVVLDYAMPELDGSRVADAMKRIKPEVPILLFTAHTSVPRQLKELADAYALKGETPQEVLRKLDGLLELRDLPVPE
jgi:DNA-binding response OmpR family regulator